MALSFWRSGLASTFDDSPFVQLQCRDSTMTTLPPGPPEKVLHIAGHSSSDRNFTKSIICLLRITISETFEPEYALLCVITDVASSDGLRY